MDDRRTKRRATPFCIFCLCGLGSVLLDLDHIAALVLAGLPITWENLARHAGRPLHLPALLVSGLVCLVFGALYVGRLTVRDS